MPDDERVEASGADTLPEGLSDRELDVLRLLDSELSGPEIARRLFVSVNTFRTHTKHIFTQARRADPPRCRPPSHRPRPPLTRAPPHGRPGSDDNHPAGHLTL